MKNFLLVLLLALCRLLTSNGSVVTDNAQNAKTLLYAFNNPQCTNPCWLGIEVGITDKADTIAILENYDIKYDTRGVIHIYDLPNGLMPGISPEGIPSPYGNIVGDINVGENGADIVQSMDFYLDICVSTLLAAYGTPYVWFTQNGIPSTLVYPAYQLFFSIDPATQRVDGVFLHGKDAMPLSEDLEDWSPYANIFSDDCSDVLTKRED